MIGNASSTIINTYCSFINNICLVNPFINKKEFAMKILNDLQSGLLNREDKSPYWVLLGAIMRNRDVAPRMKKEYGILRSVPKEGRKCNECFNNAKNEFFDGGGEMAWGLWITNPTSTSVSAVWHAVNRNPDGRGGYYDTAPSDTPERAIGIFIPSVFSHLEICRMFLNQTEGTGITATDVRYDLFMLKENGRFHIIRVNGAYFDVDAGKLVSEGGGREYLGWYEWTADGTDIVPHLHAVPMVVG
jgi:hypothetical protein